MLLSKPKSVNHFNKVHNKKRQRLSAPCFLSNTTELNLYLEDIKIQIYNAIK